MIGTNINTININTPAIVTTNGLAIPANSGRIGWTIVNCSTAVLYVRMGGTASSSVFHIPLKAGSGTDDGTGGSVGQETGVIYQGDIFVSSSSPRFTVVEFAP